MTINVGQRGEIVIPKKVRKALGIQPGSRVKLFVSKGKAEIVPSEENMVDRWEKIAKENPSKIKKYDSDRAYEEMMREQESVHRR